MSTYQINLQDDNVLKIGFGSPAQNDQIVKDATSILDELDLPGGSLIKINGPASLPVAIAIGHAVHHKYGAVGVFDPKLGKYVVAVSHGNEYQVGQLVD